MTWNPRQQFEDQIERAVTGENGDHDRSPQVRRTSGEDKADNVRIPLPAIPYAVCEALEYERLGLCCCPGRVALLRLHSQQGVHDGRGWTPPLVRSVPQMVTFCVGVLIIRVGFGDPLLISALLHDGLRKQSCRIGVP